MTSREQTRYNLVQLSMQLRATEKLQERSLAARLSYQAWRGVEADTALVRKEEQNQGLLALTVRVSVVCQGSRARSLGNQGEDDRLSHNGYYVKSNPGRFSWIGPLPTPETARRCCVYITPMQECLSS